LKKISGRPGAIQARKIFPEFNLFLEILIKKFFLNLK